MAWFLNPALTRFRQEVNAHWPGRDKTSDGTIGDAAHASRSSDHNPDSDGSVDAWDMDVDRVDVAACKRAFEAHEASSYWIHNDRISFRSESWNPRSYAYAGPGRNRHDHHVHWNSRQAAENSTKPWFTTNVKPLPLEDDDMIDQATFNGFMNNWLQLVADEGGSDASARRIRRLIGGATGTTAIAAALGQVDESVVAGLSTLLVPAIVAAVTEAVGDVPAEALQEAVEAGVRNVLGGLNDAPPVEG